MINDYLELPFVGVSGVRCPYYIGKKSLQRGQLRVLIGKGAPREIVEEAKIISIQYSHGIFDKHGLCHIPPEKKANELKNYLIDTGLGIDCSGFVIQVLDEHYLETKNIRLSRALHIAPAKHFIRYLISRLRPVENISVRVLADERNSEPVRSLNNIHAGDLVIMLDTGRNHKRDHILLITQVTDKSIFYAHARAWSNEGKYGHGVAVGEIQIVNPAKKNLLDQNWLERGYQAEKNETYLEAKNAKVLQIRRLKI
ncbi:MAG: hypothetical protein COU31_01030 [Candidatus Magasanikbacteria bacterium CG10_big_fil_rev_8_21_14_0_10_40_10]|uniref:Uncharacterized protein n=1 Tax=Candidatus Magasanikbacteria bacterium CG10_big_fil_rev_8_21_14_0_10_40_10 TaxID=1974648 RepID=A0A2M6W4T2_9BACT|nr:MAG: hypothetical protein COU31_01030 [Candidatus Magasanikbacteria bacterium CG10_big_fil_rev_8_21_14_0_10_40_10]